MTLFAGYGAHPVFYLFDIGVLSPRTKRLGCETDNSTSLGCEMKNGYSCTSIPLIELLGLELKSSYAVMFKFKKNCVPVSFKIFSPLLDIKSA
jgi:hypothetical protein